MGRNPLKEFSFSANVDVEEYKPSSRQVVVAMSGGVDSSVAAAVLAEQGYKVVGVGLQVWDYGDKETFGSCCAPSDFADARRVAESLGIPFYILDAEDVFRESVVEPFVASYADGRTPNPCVACNQKVKFHYLMKKALGFGSEVVATGHYASIVREKGSGRLAVSRGADLEKDQSYFLFDLSQEQLARIIFPLSGFTKEQVREKARDLGLVVADKPESQEICFIPEGDTSAFLERELGDKAVSEGDVVAADGTILGRHRGYAYYTIGQRRGLGVATGVPLYVTDIEPAANRLEVGADDALWKRGLLARQVTWALPPRPEKPVELSVQIRSRHRAALAEVERLQDDKARVVFQEPQRAITPGQAVVFYAGDVVAGGGWIEASME
jgi:tRNA-specific 2-thiouridylase